MDIFNRCSSFFSVISVLGDGHYIHRKRQFRIEQELATEEIPYPYRADPGKEKDLMVPVYLLQLETLEDLLQKNNALTEKKTIPKSQGRAFKNYLREERLAR